MWLLLLPDPVTHYFLGQEYIWLDRSPSHCRIKNQSCFDQEGYSRKMAVIPQINGILPLWTSVGPIRGLTSQGDINYF